MHAHKKAAGLGRGEAANQKHYVSHRIGTIQKTQHRRPPAYGRELAEAKRQGYTVPWLCIVLDWNIGRAFPRVVIPVDTHTDQIDFRVVAGLGCMVAHRGETIRALDVAEAALIAGATSCPIFDVAIGRLTTTTDEVKAIRGMGVAV